MVRHLEEVTTCTLQTMRLTHQAPTRPFIHTVLQADTVLVRHHS